MAKVTFRQDRCKGCGHCVNICPKKIISFSDKLNVKGYYPAYIRDDLMEKCIGCASCGKICPDSVITVEK